MNLQVNGTHARTLPYSRPRARAEFFQRSENTPVDLEKIPAAGGHELRPVLGVSSFSFNTCKVCV